MSDKRQVATDALETLGMIIDEHAGRDAIHLAVEPVMAGEPLDPGEDIGLVDGVAYRDPGDWASGQTVGIVDPFLKARVYTGQRFWLVVYPRQITSLRHVWAHPAIPEAADSPVRVPPDKEASEVWLRKFIDESDCPGYDEVLAAASGGYLEEIDGYGGPAYENDGESLFFHGRDAHSKIPPEFWDHVEVVTGKKIDGHKRAEWFSCSC